MEYFGITMMVVAVVLGVGYLLWRTGKLTRFGSLPKPPTEGDGK